jgi:hypothetical protein
MKHLHQKFVTSKETIDGIGMTKVHDLEKRQTTYNGAHLLHYFTKEKMHLQA